MDPDTTQEVLRCHREGMRKRAIARKLGINVKTVRRLLRPHETDAAPPVPREPPERKLAPFLDTIAQKAQQGLTATRILREIREAGYSGGRTILTDHLRTLRGAMKAPRRQFRRFETSPAEESQADWSPFRVSIGGREQTAHCFAMVLCYSRKLFIQFHRDERLPTLLSAHVDAFAAFKGVSRHVVYDNMATITFGRRRREILWNPAFLAFARHYAFEPVLCAIADPDRKGKIESVFRFVAQDLLRGRSFESWDALDAATRQWLETIANRRCHSTTRQIPDEAWLMERDFLTALPEVPFPVYRELIRPVYEDGLVAVDGTRYSVPAAALGNERTVTVRCYPRHIEILKRDGVVIATHRTPDIPGGVILEKEHYAQLRRKRREGGGETARRFLAHFPAHEGFLAGLKRRMKTLTPIHVAEILRLTQSYGEGAARDALACAAGYGNFSAYAVCRILRDRFPEVTDASPSLLPEGVMHGTVEDVETGAYEDYREYCHGGATDDADATARHDKENDNEACCHL